LLEQTVENALQRRQVGYTPKGGHLDEGVVIAKRLARGRAHRVFWVSFRKRARKIAHLVEFGTAPHYQPLRRIMHPGARPYPFFRPAFETTKQEVVGRFSRKTFEKISAAAKRIR
jgi:hypothetical protein